MDAEEAKRKLIKIIGGVILHVVEEMDAEITPEERTRKLDEAIRLGYSYGLTYPFIDDILDANVLSNQEKKRYSDFIRTTLITGSVPELGEWTGKNAELIRFIHSELRDAFECIKTLSNQRHENLFSSSRMCFLIPRKWIVKRTLSNANYTNEELYIPVILKSSSSRLITRSVISAPEDEGFDTPNISSMEFTIN